MANYVLKDIQRNRVGQIDACLVRIMKARKVLGHTELMMECIDQLKQSFTPDTKAIKKRIEVLLEKEYIERANHVVEDIQRNRVGQIDACLVRTMKARKVLGHTELVMECIDQLKQSFIPDTKAIKKRIEVLLDEYIERDNGQPDRYKYLA